MKFSSTKPLDRRAFLEAGGLGLAGLLLAGGGVEAQDIRRARPTRVVATRAGRIRGMTLDGNVNAFYGVPYGASTAGAGRFMPPVTVPEWSGVRDTIAVADRAPQDDRGPIPEVYALDRRQPMSEDCLHLNLWTRELGAGDRPVLVWLHGGGFSSGSGDWLLYDGARLAGSQDVVVVTVTHRLNAFGFLYLPEIGGAEYAEASNVGMRDIVLALEWVRENVAAFGGNPDNVTLFGQSGGGRKVSVLTGMPAAKGLFHRAIVMSGSELTGVPKSEATAATERFMSEAGARSVQALKAMPMDQLRSAAASAEFGLGPTLDGTTLPEHPYDPVATPISADVPLLIGTTSHEITFTRGVPLDPIDDATLTRLVAENTRADAPQTERLIDLYREEHAGISNIDLYQILVSDNGYRMRAWAQAERKAEQGTAPVYMYYFTWRSPVREGKLKAFHTLDIPFAFNNVEIAASMTGARQDRYLLADRISGAFAAFARSGEPSHAGLPRWPAFTTSERATMVLDNECRVLVDPSHAERLALAALAGNT